MMNTMRPMPLLCAALLLAGQCIVQSVDDRFSYRTLDIRNAANRGFCDDEGANGRGSWNDQGPTNDLHALKPGPLPACDGRLVFDIVDETENEGRSCLALSGLQHQYPREIGIDAQNAGGRFLYILSCLAWAPGGRVQTGEVEAVYADGSTQALPVFAEQHVGNWWSPYEMSDAVIAWNGENAESIVGLYLTQFEFRDIPQRLVFRMAPSSNAVWCIAAAATGNERLDLTEQQTPHYYVEGKDWTRLDFTGMTAPDSILDFSKFTDKPAGKHGPLMIDENGHFFFRDEPGKRVRFLGPNFVANYHPDEAQLRIVDQLSRMGYNMVRFHHYEGELQIPGKDNSTELEPSHLDCLDKFFARLKEAGIYITIDLYASRRLLPGDNIKECDPWKDEYAGGMKVLCPVSETAMENWKAFARNLLTHINPYTGMTWAEDPTLAIINLMNEDPLTTAWNFPKYHPIYQQKYNEWLAEQGMDTPENRLNRGGLFVEFLNDLQIRCIREQMRFLKDELHVQAQLTDINCVQTFTLIEPRGILPLVDCHQYWDHPTCPVKPWSLPYRFSDASSLQQKAWAPRNLMPVRIFGKPFIVTEYNFCNTNPFRMECGPLMGGYAAMQDWDGLNRFAWTHFYNTVMGDNPICTPRHFDINNDPLGQLDERVIWFLFMRGDVAPAMESPAYAFTTTREQIRKLGGPPDGIGIFLPDFSTLGLYTRIGSLPRNAEFSGVKKLMPLENGWRNNLDATTENAMARLDEAGRITSSTGEIMLDTQNTTCTIVTPRSEVLTGKGDIQGHFLAQTDSTRFATIGLFAMDGEELANSKSLLLLHIPNIGSTKQRFANNKKHLLEDWGHAPILVERASASIAIRLPGEWNVMALKLDGTPNGTIPSSSRDGVLSFTARTDALPGGIMAYHITKE